MSAQFGRWNIDGQPVDPGYLQKAKEMLAPYAPDGQGGYIKDSVGILYRAFHTTKESRNESQPFVTPSGSVLCWDGRLDNREELLRELGEPLTASATDVEIVAAAYEAKGTGCFARLVGDWALSIWEPKNRSVVLAKDPIGTRHLYYSFDKDQITWSTILDPLVLLAGKSFALEEEYIAGWLSFFPATHLTPYVGIHSVPPSCFVRLEAGRQAIRKYWDFDPFKRIRYKTDGEYEEHFRHVFEEAVRRRLRSDSPVLAELSGGMDSSSIVCMADTIIARGGGETPRLDTVSYFDDSEPNWNERPYFTKVEEKRGRVGSHIDISISSQWLLNLRFDGNSFTPIPLSGNQGNAVGKQLAACTKSQGNRVLLSGVGGDEVTGGVPTAMPELQDLLTRARFKIFVRQLTVWALNKRKPWLYLFFEAARGFLPPHIVRVPKHQRPAPWLNASFISQNREALRGYEKRISLFGPLPSFQDSIITIAMLLRQLGCDCPCPEPLFEKRYPYLDRDLLEFLYAMPRDQLVRPGQRRSLMRRALIGIVPDEVLARKRKAFATRATLAMIFAEWPHLVDMSQQMISTSLGIVAHRPFLEALHKARGGTEIPFVLLMRALRLEAWLRQLRKRGILQEGMPMSAKDVSPCDQQVLMGQVIGKGSAS